MSKKKISCKIKLWMQRDKINYLNWQLEGYKMNLRKTITEM